jgi:hypothetical protein
MGKGKTSVISPLLYWYYTINKIPCNIITPIHLVEKTKNYIYFTNLLFNNNNKINVYSDTVYKLGLLKQKDKELPNDNSFSVITPNTINIIDEFDLLYNYLQSNFNYINTIKSETLITKDMFDYIFNYIHKKSNDTIIKLDKFINNALNQILTYNKDYGIESMFINILSIINKLIIIF